MLNLFLKFVHNQMAVQIAVPFKLILYHLVLYDSGATNLCDKVASLS